jgi:hypothetical protein
LIRTPAACAVVVIFGGTGSRRFLVGSIVGFIETFG